MIQGRKYSAGDGYRYGFNGKESDNEVKGEGNQQDYGMRIYDPRLGRFLSVDPISNEYPWYTPYQFAGNEVPNAIDLDGLEPRRVNMNLTPPPKIMAVDATSIAGHTKSRLPVQAQATSNNRVTGNIQPSFTTVAPYRAAGEEISKTLKRNYENYQITKNNGVGNDPIKTSVYWTLQTTKVTVQGSLQQGENVIGGIKEGDYGKAAGNAALFALNFTPFVKVPGNLPSRLARVIPEKYGANATTLGQAGAADVFVTDASQLVGLTTSEVIAKRLTLVDESGNLIKGPFRIIEFDTPPTGLAQPIRRTNPGFVGGGKTAGGATEYVLPNLKINGLQNVTQKTIQ